MSQPKWKLLAQLGDANPYEHGGHFLFVDTTGVYDPESELLKQVEDNKWEIHRYSLTKCSFVNNILSDNKYHPSMAAWFAEDLPEVAKSMDVSQLTLIRQLCGEDILARAQAYKCLVDYFGSINFDEYPTTITRKSELIQRYRTLTR